MVTKLPGNAKGVGARWRKTQRGLRFYRSCAKLQGRTVESAVISTPVTVCAQSVSAKMEDEEATLVSEHVLAATLQPRRHRAELTNVNTELVCSYVVIYMAVERTSRV